MNRPAIVAREGLIRPRQQPETATLQLVAKSQTHPQRNRKRDRQDGLLHDAFRFRNDRTACC